MNLISYFNGKYILKKDIYLDVEDLAFTRGYAAYECLRAYGKKLFYFDEHFLRLSKTLTKLLLPLPKIDLQSILNNLIEKNPHEDLVFRIYITGSGSLIILSDLPTPPTPTEIKEGVSVMTTPLPRTFHKIKSTNYTSAMVSLNTAKKQNFYEALYLDTDQNLLEMTKANFFAIIDGTLFTAKDFVLYGITRNIVINIAKQNSIPLVEGPIHKSLISSFSGAFLTSTTKEILPITQIDQTPIPKNPLTDRLLNYFQSFTSPTPVVL